LLALPRFGSHSPCLFACQACLPDCLGKQILANVGEPNFLSCMGKICSCALMASRAVAEVTTPLLLLDHGFAVAELTTITGPRFTSTAALNRSLLPSD